MGWTNWSYGFVCDVWIENHRLCCGLCSISRYTHTIMWWFPLRTHTPHWASGDSASSTSFWTVVDECWTLNTTERCKGTSSTWVWKEKHFFIYIYIYTQTHTVPAFNLPAYTRNKKWGEVTVNKTLMPPPPLNLWTFVQGKKTDLHHSSGDVINITLNDAASLLKTFSSFSKQFFSH